MPISTQARGDWRGAAWGAAMAVRVVSLSVYALLVFKTLGLVPAPALITFAGLLLVTSVVEPLFLNPDSNSP